MKVEALTSSDGWTLLVPPVSGRPLVNHDITAGGLLLADSQRSRTVSPDLAFWCPLIVTLIGATEQINNDKLIHSRNSKANSTDMTGAG